jgi:F-type H+-transporting ATPase subunit b
MSGSYIAELIGFVIFIGLIGWKIVPRVMPLVDRRRETIRSSIDGARSARESAEQVREGRLQLLEEARREAATILEQAKQTAVQIVADGESRAAEEYERLVRDARAEVDVARQRARDEVSAEIVGIVIGAAEEVVRAEIDESRQRSLVGEVIAAAEASRVGV